MNHAIAELQKRTAHLGELIGDAKDHVAEARRGEAQKREAHEAALKRLDDAMRIVEQYQKEQLELNAAITVLRISAEKSDA